MSCCCTEKKAELLDLQTERLFIMWFRGVKIQYYGT